MIADRLRRLSAWRAYWPVALGLGLVVYFGYHAVSGNRGVMTWRNSSDQIERSMAELADVLGRRVALERKVARLRHDSLDPDLVDELARHRLSFVDPMDVIILLDDPPVVP